MSRRHQVTQASVVLVALAVATLAGSAVRPQPASASTEPCGGVTTAISPSTVRVTFSPGVTCWVVPEGVTVARFNAAGGSGEATPDSTGGRGALVGAPLHLTPGSTLTISVGASGAAAAAGERSRTPVGNHTGGRGGNTCAECYDGLPGGHGGDGSFVDLGATNLMAAGGGGGAGAAGYGWSLLCRTMFRGGRGHPSGDRNDVAGWVAPPTPRRGGAGFTPPRQLNCDADYLSRTGGGGGAGGGYEGGYGGAGAGWVQGINFAAHGGGGGTSHVDAAAVALGATPVVWDAFNLGDGYVTITYSSP